MTEEELKMVERADRKYFQTLSEWVFNEENPDVDKTEMMLSESDSKYVRGLSWRRTFLFENSSEALSELSSDNSSECLNENLDDYASEHENLYRFEKSPELSYDNSFETLDENLSENSSENQSCFKNCCNCSLQ